MPIKLATTSAVPPTAIVCLPHRHCDCILEQGRVSLQLCAIGSTRVKFRSTNDLTMARFGCKRLLAGQYRLKPSASLVGAWLRAITPHIPIESLSELCAHVPIASSTRLGNSTSDAMLPAVHGHTGLRAAVVSRQNALVKLARRSIQRPQVDRVHPLLRDKLARTRERHLIDGLLPDVEVGVIPNECAT